MNKKFVEMEVSNDCQIFEVKINNTTKKVVFHSSEYTPISLEEIQELVDKLIKSKMITLFGDSITNVSINIWEIDETDDLHIETYHTDPNLPINELFDDYDRTMNYDEFLVM